MQDGAGVPGADDRYSRDLLRAVEKSFGPWFRGRLREIAGREDARLDAAADRANAWVSSELASLLATDPEEQRTNPLQLLRTAARIASPVLHELNLPVPSRDEFESRAMPEDEYGIGPLAWIDLGDDVHEAGITWGAWKAATIISRHKSAEE